MPGEGSNRGLRHGDVTGVPSNPAIRQLLCKKHKPGQETPRNVPSQQLPKTHKVPGTQHRSIGQGVSSPQIPGKLSFLEGQGSTTSTSTPAAGFGLYCLLPGQGDGLRWGSKDEVPSMVPHLVFLPRILLPFTWYSWSLPTTANGIISCGKTKTGLWLLPENCSGTQTSEQSPTLSCFQEGFMG